MCIWGAECDKMPLMVDALSVLYWTSNNYDIRHMSDIISDTSDIISESFILIPGSRSIAAISDDSNLISVAFLQYVGHFRYHIRPVP